MGVISLPANVEQDRQNGIKANSVHVQNNFDALLTAVNNKLEKDGSILPTSDLSMNGYKITTMATPSNGGDAATKGYVDNNACMLAGAQTITGNKNFTGTTIAVTQSVSDDSTKLATTGFVKDILEAMYPVGGLYFGTQNSCPMATIMPGTTWALVSAGHALWTGNGTSGSGTTTNANYASAPANTTIAAGLPDHSHQYTKVNNSYPMRVQDTVALTSTETGWTGNASVSNPIYGRSTTVQPPAYVVNVWRRTA